MEMVESGKYALTHDGLSDGCTHIEYRRIYARTVPYRFQTILIYGIQNSSVNGLFQDKRNVYIYLIFSML